MKRFLTILVIFTTFYLIASNISADRFMNGWLAGVIACACFEGFRGVYFKK